MKFNLKQIILGIFFIFYSSISHAQDKIFSKVEIETLSDIQKQMLENAQKSIYTQETWVVKIGDLTKYVQEGKLLLELPIIKEELLATETYTEYTTDDNFVWYGEFTKQQGEIMLITGKDNTKFGYIQMGKDHYEIQGIGDEISIIVKQDTDKFPDNDCPSGTEDIKIPSLNCLGAPCVARVLILYTPGVAGANLKSIIEQKAITAFEQVNTAFAKSKVFGKLLRVGKIEEFLFLENFSNIEADITLLNSDPTINTLRQVTRADIVILLTATNPNGGGFSYFSGSSPTDGSVGVGGFANPAMPCAIVNIDAAGSVFSFAHEVGHKFNARHENDGLAPPGRGHKFTPSDKMERMTIMHQKEAGIPRVLHYSNPKVAFQGSPTGTSTRNNVCNINSTFCAVAKFMPDFMRM